MRKTRDTKNKWTGWIDKDILSKVVAMAAEKGIPVNYMIEEILRNAVVGK